MEKQEYLPMTCVATNNYIQLEYPGTACMTCVATNSYIQLEYLVARRVMFEWRVWCYCRVVDFRQFRQSLSSYTYCCVLLVVEDILCPRELLLLVLFLYLFAYSLTLLLSLWSSICEAVCDVDAWANSICIG